MKDIDPDDFRVTKKIKLQDIATLKPLKFSEQEIEAELADIRVKLSKVQDKMYAYNKYSLLVCLQGMDTSGKDSMIREVFKDISPRGVVVSSFKVPTSTELEHDFLWRHYIALPERGQIGVFNRTHYENVLVTRVHPEFILGENIPGINSVKDIDDKFWENRFESIREFEAHLVKNGTIILKFFLHLSKEEQRQRLLRRLEEEKHNWKFSEGDLKERALWDEYAKYYEEAINETSKKYAPWYIIPADDKPTSRLIVGSIILDTLEEYKDIQNPELSDEIQSNLKSFRERLEADKQ